MAQKTVMFTLEELRRAVSLSFDDGLRYGESCHGWGTYDKNEALARERDILQEILEEIAFRRDVDFLYAHINGRLVSVTKI